MNKEELIKHFSYYYNDSEDFVEEYLDNFMEMDRILNMIFINIKDMGKDYNISLTEKGIYFENKKTRNSYTITIEF